MHYIKILGVIVLIFCFYGVVIYTWLDPLFMFMPIYRSDQCRIVQI